MSCTATSTRSASQATLAFVDEAVVSCAVSGERLWAALTDTLRAQLAAFSDLSRPLALQPPSGTAEFAGRAGEALPGFLAVDAEPGRRLVLAGRHRFARWQLTFQIDGHQLRARTDAAFPGWSGALYRAAVIGTGGHRFAIRRLLRQVAGHA